MASAAVTLRCPMCRARLVTTERGWRCARWGPKLGRCRFSVYRHLNSRSLVPEDLRLLVEAGVLPWPHTDGRPGWYVLDRGAPNGCRFTDQEPKVARAVPMLEPGAGPHSP